MKKITFSVRTVYGKDSIYIQDPEVAKLIATLTGKKTVDVADLKALKELGCEVEQVMPDQLAI